MLGVTRQPKFPRVASYVRRGVLGICGVALVL